ncbi:hypothetical protein HanXRQr2_Chr17g0817851 [Helianthus annuus]|uniref:Uncharacterized protein n=1 Tax=Helianthus annuus TaxID=4232 RepID=A0A9K3DKE4_HELAN|nr:hypothetical protein HanXRQr2_Chr17g0817851 [Helianthus annuus]
MKNFTYIIFLGKHHTYQVATTFKNTKVFLWCTPILGNLRTHITHLQVSLNT